MIQKLARATSRLLGPNSGVIRFLRPYYLVGLDMLHNSQGIPYTLNGIPCRIDPECRDYFAPQYEPQVFQFLKENVRPEQICFDIGAHVGIYAIQLAELTKPSGKIVAFEPEPNSQKKLWKHLCINDIARRVQIVPSAISNQKGDVDLYAAPTNGMSRLGQSNILLKDSAAPVKVPVTTIDEFCAESGTIPAWILMDIEGFEIEALLGARETIKAHKPRFVVEMHPDVWAMSRQEVESVLNELSLHLTPLTNQADPLAEYGHVVLTVQ